MNILILNSGSSSIKYKLFDMDTNEIKVSGIIEEITSHKKSLEKLLNSWSEELLKSVDAVGHRVVHGAEEFSTAVIITDEVKATINKLAKLAPLHNPLNLLGIEASEALFKNVPQVAVFDTAFHQTIPEYIYRYAVPKSWYKEHHVRKYGFHGSSHHYVAQTFAKYHDKELKQLNLITVHLGNGGSICAIKEGKSFDTSMGMTPLEGLVMGTRCGDIDPSIVTYMQQYETDIAEKLNKNSGLKGVCGTNDMREVLRHGEREFTLALDMYIHRVRKYIGAYALTLGRVDGLVFTGGIGENADKVRELICRNMQIIGLEMDEQKNRTVQAKTQTVSTAASNILIDVIKTDEELYIAQSTQNILGE